MAWLRRYSWRSAPKLLPEGCTTVPALCGNTFLWHWFLLNHCIFLKKWFASYRTKCIKLKPALCFLVPLKGNYHKYCCPSRFVCQLTQCDCTVSELKLWNICWPSTDSWWLTSASSCQLPHILKLLKSFAKSGAGSLLPPCWIYLVVLGIWFQPIIVYFFALYNLQNW